MERLTVERMIELEFWLADNRPNGTDKLGAMDYFKLYYQGEDFKYLMDAFVMPFQEVKIALIKYDSSHPKMDELAFLADLQSRFYQTPFDMLRRVRQVRRLMKYIAKNPMFKIPVNVETAIINDKVWDCLIKQDVDCTIEVQNALNYEDRRKALVNKLQVLRNMAEFNGLSLEDLITEADKERSYTD
ncbi:MAG: hypothetical protein K2H20_03265, partial [Bacilli bacterium]|nr:hypothetical protein [Bacilli bacterium]